MIGIYTDPLVELGIIEEGSPHDSQSRLTKDLKMDNLIFRQSSDFDGNGFQELYWKTKDNTAYLRTLLHADGNIQYANYQNQNQMNEYLTNMGVENFISDII